MPALHWKKTKKNRWETEEQFAGTPDFVIEHITKSATQGYRMKFRSAARVSWHVTLADAKHHAEDDFGAPFGSRGP